MAVSDHAVTFAGHEDAPTLTVKLTSHPLTDGVGTIIGALQPQGSDLSFKGYLHFAVAVVVALQDSSARYLTLPIAQFFAKHRSASIQINLRYVTIIGQAQPHGGKHHRPIRQPDRSSVLIRLP